jgi:hypothetical protein
LLAAARRRQKDSSRRLHSCAFGVFSFRSAGAETGSIKHCTPALIATFFSAAMAQYNPNNFQDRYMDLREPVRQAMIR